MGEKGIRFGGQIIGDNIDSNVTVVLAPSGQWERWIKETKASKAKTLDGYDTWKFESGQFIVSSTSSSPGAIVLDGTEASAKRAIIDLAKFR